MVLVFAMRKAEIGVGLFRTVERKDARYEPPWMDSRRVLKSPTPISVSSERKQAPFCGSFIAELADVPSTLEIHPVVSHPSPNHRPVNELVEGWEIQQKLSSA